MPNFRYKAQNSSQQPVAGELRAETVQDAIGQLEARGLTVLSIEDTQSKHALGGAEDPATDENSARVAEQNVLRTHLVRVLKNGHAMVPALRAYSEELPAGRRRREFETLIGVLERGDAQEAERVFADAPEYWLPLLGAATSSNDPGRVLQEFISESQRADELRRQWWLTISYPLLIIAIAAVVMTVLSVFVVPIFRWIFQDFNIRLPALTQVVLVAAMFLSLAWPFIVVGFALLVGAIIFISIRWPLRSGVVGRLPLFFGRSTAIARFGQIMAELLEAGLGDLDTLRIAGFLTKRKRLRKAASNWADQMQVDSNLEHHLDAPRGTATILHALTSEMPMTSRIRLLRENSMAHADRARLRLSWTRGFVEPLAILAIAFVVATVVVAMYLPLVKLIEGLSK